MKQTHAYKINLVRIEGDGEFSCPRCGATISPDEEDEEAYSIIGSKANSNGLEEIVVRCNKCHSNIHVTGFSLLQSLIDNDVARGSGPGEESTYYISRV